MNKGAINLCVGFWYHEIKGVSRVDRFDLLEALLCCILYNVLWHVSLQPHWHTFLLLSFVRFLGGLGEGVFRFCRLIHLYQHVYSCGVVCLERIMFVAEKRRLFLLHRHSGITASSQYGSCYNAVFWASHIKHVMSWVYAKIRKTKKLQQSWVLRLCSDWLE